MKDGGPAFPVPSPCYDHVEMGELYGMTLWDYFAAKSMQAGLATARAESEDVLVEKVLPVVAKISYAMADAMLAARESKP